MKYILVSLLCLCCACTMMPFVTEQIEEAVIFEEQAIVDELAKGHTVSAVDYRAVIWWDITLEGDVVLNSDFWVRPSPALASFVLKYDPHKMVLLPIV